MEMRGREEYGGFCPGAGEWRREQGSVTDGGTPTMCKAHAGKKRGHCQTGWRLEWAMSQEQSGASWG